MDSKEATKVVINRISRLEPEPIAKMIIGFMHFQGFSDQEMIRLALGPDSLIHHLIEKAKNARLLVSSNVISPSLSDPSLHFGPFPTAFGRMDPFWDPQLPVEHPTVKNAPLKLIPYSDYTGLEDPLDYYCPESAFSIRGARTSSSFMDHPVKTCYYFVKGFCKHGSNCRYSHGQSFPESYLRTSSPNSYDVAGENQVFSPGSLEKLELEIAGLLKSRRGNPVSIASLPMLYYEKYGKTLQAEGYLTESQRHGKAGYSLTKLLARLKNSIRLIDRPHGQHAVILAEDAAKYFDLRAERNDPGPVVNGSRQIYLTFPADSTFTEEDVSNYFSNFGAVQDVRIPSQQKRMFGFVTFVSADTVKLILSNGNPHYVCDSRVLVKPYREKAKLVERKYFESFGHPDFSQSHPADINSELETGRDSWQLSQRQLIEERELELDHEMMRFAQLQLAGRAMDELRVPEGHPKFPSREHFNYLFDVLNSGSTSDDNPKYPGDHESSQGVTLPDSPFASAVGTSISAVI